MIPERLTAKDVKDLHINSDVDSSKLALHHTLGSGPDQAAPGDSSGLSSVGAIMFWPTIASAVPVGWLIPEGQYLIRTEYPELYALLATYYGSTDSSNFRLPDLRGKVIVAMDTSQIEFDTIGEVGGSKTVTLTLNQMPQHTHKTGIQNSAMAGAAGGFSAVTTFAQNGLDSAGVTGHSGVNEGHPNLQPYIVLNPIMRVR